MRVSVELPVKRAMTGAWSKSSPTATATTPQSTISPTGYSSAPVTRPHRTIPRQAVGFSTAPSRHGTSVVTAGTLWP
jgi:hypothetical protein